MEKILIAWIGRTDLRAVQETGMVGIGPIAQALDALNFTRLVLISNYPEAEAAEYTAWLRSRTILDVTVHQVYLSSPTDFGEIYRTDVAVIEKALCDHGSTARLFFHLSPGTPAMAAVWILLAKSRFPADLIESSREQGVRIAEIPFDISAEYIPSLLRRSDERLEKLIFGLPPEAPEFDSIICRSAVMQRIISLARRVAPRSVPVLIEGESGTGKELLARAIHEASTRKGKPFIAVNCGAIPSELVESEFFGHRKGAFTGAVTDRKGYFESADEGTLFLDEIGELPLAAQVKILRALQEREIVRVGDTKPVKFDVRIIAATNRTLINEVAAENFRADLYYRLAVAVLHLPPLREREGDLGLLIDRLLEEVNRENSSEPGYSHKNISAAAKNIMLSYPWPGNVRELVNTLRRAAVWSAEDVISDSDIRESLLHAPKSETGTTAGASLGSGVNLPEILGKLASEYLAGALRETGGNKTKAAQLLGLPNYQTLTNWLKKYGLE